MKILLTAFFILFSQELSFTWHQQEYDAIIVDPTKEVIRMHWLDDKGIPYKNIAAVKQASGKDILMITNGGMFQPGNVPVGLYIENGKTIRPLDTAQNKPGNFYLLPNGVFYTDKEGAHVSTTSSFKNKDISYATQSGPMLVIDGNIHPLFKQGSENVNLRSGVGIMPDGKVVFIISKSNQTNFYEFASIFKEKFECKNALYLDGVISKMYLKGNRKEDVGGDFGVMIAVSAQ
ncbi:phosphodiester glycosidase family protein [Chitinophaga sancti]|uniref:phosphodiester glycosidase family protein n=1 Tax=Chitinophaga sancti TaxID=1004 RepID=UPI002A74F974|nr:phosphodiester glycosidase family protein [Chitinophaga sancti]WPQ66272.1 phosphodiester glycosidase family protein [Chitinophaga sancti]